MKPRHHRLLVALATIALAVALIPADASAKWTFDEDQCSPKTDHQVMTLPPPSVMLMVDRSGSMEGSKWSAAKSAIDSVTTSMTSSDPDEVEFGVGLFHHQTATIDEEASANANSAIMDVLDGTSPDGGTPMENAINTMASSDTVQGTIDPPPPYTLLDSATDAGFHDLPDNNQWQTFMVTEDGSATIDKLKMDMHIFHAYGIADLDIELRHGGKTVRLSDAGQGQRQISPYSFFALGFTLWSDRVIDGFDGMNMNGIWELRIRDGWPDYDGSLLFWKLKFLQSNPVPPDRASAGILVTDGKPSGSRSGTVQAACDHRDTAPLYVVGLGSGTDREYNDVLAAAGGTGTCDNGDPCDDPYNWGAYDGHCDGSFQTGDANGLTDALSQIANDISCTFPLDILGGGSVPASTQGCEGYDCVSVQLDDGIGRIYHADSSESPRGWTWASSTDRQNVKLDSYYCGQIQQDNVHLVETQVACLCTQDFGTSCDVQDPRTCECETGRWACDYGTDYCDPNTASQCPADLVGEGDICAEGIGVCRDEGETYCDPAGDLRCSAQAKPKEEDPEVSCDSRDNDCNGVVDDVVWQGDTCQVDDSGDPSRAASDINAETNRCSIGDATCVDGVEGCATLGKMPEVCNGLDDDCNGTIDNLTTSWDDTTKPNDTKYSLPAGYETAACYERNICRCPDGHDAVEGDDYMSYLEGWANGEMPPEPTCYCGSSLSR